MLLDYERLSMRDRRALGDLDDSKQRTAEQREALYPVVIRAAARVAVTIRCVRGIDARGLHVTNLEALARCLERVAVPGAACLSDGFPLGQRCAVEHQAVIDGDARSAAIAAASVIAKVTRDRYMHADRRRIPRIRVGGQRRLLDARAPRRDHRARPVAASPPLVRVDRLLPAETGVGARTQASTISSKPPKNIRPGSIGGSSSSIISFIRGSAITLALTSSRFALDS